MTSTQYAICRSSSLSIASQEFPDFRLQPYGRAWIFFHFFIFNFAFFDQMEKLTLCIKNQIFRSTFMKNGKVDFLLGVKQGEIQHYLNRLCSWITTVKKGKRNLLIDTCNVNNFWTSIRRLRSLQQKGTIGKVRDSQNSRAHTASRYNALVTPPSSLNR